MRTRISLSRGAAAGRLRSWFASGFVPFFGLATAVGVAASPGEKLWELGLGAGVSQGPAVDLDGTLYLGTYDGKLNAVDGAKGTNKWTAQAGAGSLSAPVISESMVFIVGSNPNAILYAFSKEGGKKWQVSLEGFYSVTPALASESQLIAVAGGGTVWTVQTSTGAATILIRLNENTMASPAIAADGTIYIGTTRGRFVALNPDTRAVKWSIQAEGAINYSPAIGPNGTLYLSDASGVLRALAGPTGHEIWRVKLAEGSPGPDRGPILTPAVLTPDGVIILSSSDTLYALDSLTGEQLWASPMSDPPIVATIGANGTVFTGSLGSGGWWWSQVIPGQLQAIDSRTGRQKWSFTPGTRLTAPFVIGADGQIYVCTAEQKILALDAGEKPVTNVWSSVRGDHRNTGSREVSGPPVVLSLPSTWNAAEGLPVALSANVGGSRPLRYQWSYNGVAVTNATNALFTLATARFEDAGAYKLTVSNALGTAESGVATLNVGYSLVALVAGPGRVRRSVAPEIVPPGTVVTLTAEPGLRRKFIRWSGQVTSAENPLIVTVQSNIWLFAEFERHPSEKAWAFNRVATVNYAPAVAPDGTVYFNSVDGRGVTRLHALEGMTGKLVWETERSGGILSPPIAAPENVLYIRTSDGYLAALDRSTGKEKWKRAVGGLANSAAAVGVDGTVYQGTGTAMLALDGRTGMTNWLSSKRNGAGSPVLSADGLVLFPGNDGYFYALDALTGVQRWRQLIGEGQRSPALGKDGTLYVGAGPARLWALNSSSGRKRWEAVVPASITGPPIAGERAVYFASADGFVNALNAETGAQEWRAPFASSSQALALDSNGLLYTVTGSELLVLDALSGVRQWRYANEFGVRTPPIFGNQTVLVGSDVGLVALYTGSSAAAGSWPQARGDGANRASHQISGPVVLLKQPEAAAVPQGSSISLGAYAGGALPLFYQWQRDGNALPGETNAELTLSSLELNHSASYSVMVSNTVSSVTSRIAALQVGYTLEIPDASGGSVERFPDLSVYSPGAVVELRAVPQPGHEFLGWSGSATGTANPLRFEIQTNTTISARFTLLPGDRKWEFAAGGPIRASPALGTNGLVYFGSADQNVYAVDVESGALLWKAPYPAPVLAAPVVGANGQVFAVSTDGLIRAHDAMTGTKIWQYQAEPTLSSPALGANGFLYVITHNGVVHALEAATGRRWWNKQISGAENVYASPSIGAGGIVFCASGGWTGQPNPSASPRLHALNGESGRVRWSFSALNAIQATPAIGPDGTLYIPSYNKLVYALDSASGTVKWSHLTADSLSSSAALGPDGTLYVGANDGRLYALDSASGTQKWTFLTGDTIHSSPAIAADSTVYFGSYDKNVYAVDGKTGTQKWRFSTRGLVLSSPAIASDGTVLIGSNDGKLYALAGGAPVADTSWPAFKGGGQRTGSAERPGPPLISQPPSPRRLAEGTNTFLEAVVQGSRPMTFQWFARNQPLTSAISSTLEFPIVRVADTADYTIVASNVLGIAQATARLEVGFTLGIKPQGGGDVVRDPDEEVYLPGSVVSLIPRPLTNHSFIGWRGDATGTITPFNMAMNGHKLVAARFSAVPGEKLWEVPMQHPSSALAIGSDNTVYLAGWPTNFVAVDGDTGLTKWRFITDQMVTGGAALAPDGTVVFSTGANRLYGVNSVDGKLKWQVTANALYSRPAIAPDGTIYLTSDSNGAQLTALNGATGQRKWGVRLGDGFNGTSAVVDTNGLIYVTAVRTVEGTCSWNLIAVSPAGQQLWSIRAGACNGSQAVLGEDNSVFVVGSEGVLRKFSGNPGKVQWEFQLEQQGVMPFVLGPGGAIYLLSPPSSLIELDQATGQRRQRYTFPFSFWHVYPALDSDGNLVATTQEGIVAVNMTSGAVQWQATFPSNGGPVSIGPEGVVYSSQNVNGEPRLVAIQGTSPLAETPWPVQGGNPRNTGGTYHPDTVRILGVQIATDGVHFIVRTRAAHRHHLEASDSLGPTDWHSIATADGTGSEIRLLDTSRALQARFYRLRVE